MSRFALPLAVLALTVPLGVPLGAQAVLTIGNGGSMTIQMSGKDSGGVTMSAAPGVQLSVQAVSQSADADSVRVVNLTPKDGSDLAALLKKQYANAATAGRTPFVELGATWCGPCKQLAASLGDQRMRNAFAGTYIVHLDVDEWKGKLTPLGFVGDGIPAFFPIDSTGKATGPKIDGGAWGDNIPENMAPPLKKFFSEHLKSATK